MTENVPTCGACKYYIAKCEFSLSLTSGGDPGSKIGSQGSAYIQNVSFILQGCYFVCHGVWSIAFQ